MIDNTMPALDRAYLCAKGREAVDAGRVARVELDTRVEDEGTKDAYIGDWFSITLPGDPDSVASLTVFRDGKYQLSVDGVIAEAETVEDIWECIVARTQPNVVRFPESLWPVLTFC